MAPTIQRPGGGGSGAPRKPSRGAESENRGDLVVRVKYCNNLPDIPFDPKFLAYPFDPHRFIAYNPTGLERNYKYELLTEHDLGVTIDLINPDIYNPPEYERPPMDPMDEKLLEEELNTVTNTKRSEQHSKAFSWFRKPDYISTEQTRFQPTSIEKIESDIGYTVRKKMNVDDLYQDRDSQIEAIERTFQDAQRPITHHHSKPHVTPVEVFPVLPDSHMWKYPCAQVIFDSDPAPGGVPQQQQLDQMAQAMIRGVMDESGEQFVAYFLPSDETLAKRQSDIDDGVDYRDEAEYEYKMHREYNWNVKSKASKGYEENFFFIFRDDGVFYNELETRVRLSKRRLKPGQQISNSKLVVRHRPLNKQEHKMQRYRERNLEPLAEDEDMSEEEEEEEEEEQQQQDQQSNRGKSGSRSRSRSRSVSRSKSRSKSRSVSRSRSRSVSRSASRSKSRSASRSKSKSKSASKSRSRSASKSKSRSRSVSKSKSRSASRSKSRSASRSKSRSPSRSRSKSKSKSKSASRSPSKSRSRSASRSKSKSRSASKSKSPSRSRSPSKEGSRSRSRSGSGSKSRSRSRSGSRASSRSGSSGSGSGSE